MTRQRTETRPLIFDCDPGQDDAISLMMAFAPPRAGEPVLDIRAVTVTAGNTSLQKCQRNARMIAELCGRSDIPVYAGCDAPLELPLATAEEVHGSEGLDGIEIFEPAMPLQDEHAVDAIIRLCRSVEDVVLVPTGPLTNIATAFRRAPDIIPRIGEIVIMGGARSEGGNITPSAEFNAYVDPHAAAEVFAAPVQKTVFGLDVTHQVLIRPDHVAKLGQLGNRMTDILVPMLSGGYAEFDAKKFGTNGTPIHDACTIAYILQPQIFTFRDVGIRVETGCDLTRGHTSVDYWHGTAWARDCRWAVGADADAFFNLMAARLALYGS